MIIWLGFFTASLLLIPLFISNEKVTSLTFETLDAFEYTLSAGLIIGLSMIVYALALLIQNQAGLLSLCLAWMPCLIILLHDIHFVFSGWLQLLYFISQIEFLGSFHQKLLVLSK